MSAKMQQGIYFLQLPILELENTIEEELDENPLLEILEEKMNEDSEEEEEPSDLIEELSFDERNFEVLRRLDDDFKDSLYQEGFSSERGADEDRLHAFLNSLVQKRETLFEFLMKQAGEAFSEKKERDVSEGIIGSLDEKGFLTTSLDEIAFLTDTEEAIVRKVLMKIKEFDPPGIAAGSLQECLLIQLRRKGKEKTLAYRIIDEHFENLLQNKINLIKAKLKAPLEKINEAVKIHIAALDLNPGYQFGDESPKEIAPDLLIVQEEDALVVKVNNERLPELVINRKYVNMFQDKDLSKDEKEFLKKKIESAKWLIKNISQRQSTMQRIGEWLLDKQRAFFSEPKGELTPACMQELATDLELHESTIARAINNKYLYCDRGMIPLRHFFTASYTSLSGETLSAKTVKDTLKEIIGKENKKKPLSDNFLEKELKKRGIPCARRTIAKYRGELNIGNVHQRREF